MRYASENQIEINLINFGKLDFTKGLEEWIALPEVMAPKKLAVRM